MLVYLLFALGLILIIKGGDEFVEAAVSIARRLGMSELVIGATIVSLGTTLPEVLVSTMAGISGSADIAIGNAVGSVICNTSFIAALVLLFSKPRLDRRLLSWRVLYFFGALGLLYVVSAAAGEVARPVGAALLFLFAVYTFLSSRQRKLAGRAKASEEPFGRAVLILIVTAVCLFFGAKLLVDSGIEIARALGVPERFIASTIIALGTSLPELMTAIISIKIGMGALSIGNVIGANILNVLCVIGIPAAICGVAVSQAAMSVDIPYAALVMLIMTLPPAITGRTYRIQGVALLCCYAVYVTFLA
ncbi:MAG TPA: calcium/sodium antiporter [Terriglobales bacterium]|nr:calcium/sodium antiporter [Terriglobales bacterium]